MMEASNRRTFLSLAATTGLGSLFLAKDAWAHAVSHDHHPEAVVRRLLKAISTKDVDLILSHFHDNAIYHATPSQPVQGQAQLRQVFGFLLSMVSTFDDEIVHLAAHGDVVFTERIDHIKTPDGHSGHTQMAGIFYVSCGKIWQWTDYFDGPTFTAATGIRFA